MIHCNWPDTALSLLVSSLCLPSEGSAFIIAVCPLTVYLFPHTAIPSEMNKEIMNAMGDAVESKVHCTCNSLSWLQAYFASDRDVGTCNVSTTLYCALCSPGKWSQCGLPVLLWNLWSPIRQKPLTGRWEYSVLLVLIRRQLPTTEVEDGQWRWGWQSPWRSESVSSRLVGVKLEDRKKLETSACFVLNISAAC